MAYTNSRTTAALVKHLCATLSCRFHKFEVDTDFGSLHIRNLVCNTRGIWKSHLSPSVKNVDCGKFKSDRVTALDLEADATINNRPASSSVCTVA